MAAGHEWLVATAAERGGGAIAGSRTRLVDAEACLTTRAAKEADERTSVIVKKMKAVKSEPEKSTKSDAESRTDGRTPAAQ